AVAAELVALLHRDAPADEFTARLALLDALPDGLPHKTGLVELGRMALAVRGRLEQHEQRERGMMAVIKTAQDLARRLDVPDVLKAIVTRAGGLLRAHWCWLTIYDAQEREFKVVVSEGAIGDRTGRMTAQRERGVAGIVVTTRWPLSTADYLHGNLVIHDLERAYSFLQ